MADRHSKLLIGFLVFCFFVPALVFAGSYIINPYHFSSGGGCSASYGSEINTDANAAYPTASDTNATTGWVGYNSTFTSVTTAPYLGTYHFNVVSTGYHGRAYKALSDFSLTNGTMYSVSLYARHNGTGGDFKCGLANSIDNPGIYDNFTNTDTSYTEVKYFFTYSEPFSYIMCVENNATDDGGVYIDDFSVSTATPCYGSEINDDNNAISPTNEGNSTIGWTNRDVDIFESTTSGTPHGGSYHFHIEENTTPSANARIYKNIGTDFSLVTGTRYYLSFWAKHIGTGGSWKFGFKDTDGSPSQKIGTLSSSDTTYVHYGVSFKYSSDYSYFNFMESNAANDGGLYIDDFSIKEITAE